MVSSITKELDDYLESRIGSGDLKKKKKKDPVNFSRVPKIDNEYKTFVLEDEPTKPWHRKFLDWLFEEDSSKEADYAEKIEDFEEDRLDKVADIIEDAQESLDDLEIKEEKKVKNIFQRLFGRLRKVEAQEIEELEDIPVQVDASHMEDITVFKTRCNEEIRDALRAIRKITLRLPNNVLEDVEAMNEYQRLLALMRKYKVD
ncbi:hypothetical protein JXM83_03560 [Candidatus Woesearchaeota archaeon]|nr:hypothetical protein [Candidatus Woesearchaeota archaeon]